MIGFPLDSHVSYDEDGIPVLDRAVTSEPLRKLIHELFSDGIMPTLSTNLQVTTSSDMNVTVLPGFGIVQGCMKLELEERVLAVQAADTTYDRIDTVVLRLNDNDSVRECDFYVIQGTPSANPVHPDLTREGSIYEIGLADLFIGSNSTRITADKITDTRYDNERCGVISSISEFDTSTLNNQMVAWSQLKQSEFESWSAEQQEAFATWRALQETNFESWSEGQQSDFEEWFEGIRGILDEDAAGHLQNEIDYLRQQTGIPEEYDPDNTYAVDDYCIYDNKVYHCKKATVAGSFDEACWEHTTVLEEIQKAIERNRDDMFQEMARGSLRIDSTLRINSADALLVGTDDCLAVSQSVKLAFN